MRSVGDTTRGSACWTLARSDAFRPYQRVPASREALRPTTPGKRDAPEPFPGDGYGRSPRPALASPRGSAQRPKPCADKSPAGPAAAGSHRTCNCKRSNCLKLYCDCFSSGEYCSNCNCNCCYNNREGESYRKEAIRVILERNPTAFRPKIAASQPTVPVSPAFQSGDPLSARHCRVRFPHTLS